MSHHDYCMLLLLLSLVGFFPAVSNAAWIVRSETDNSWATGLSRFVPLRRPMIIMTQFHDGTDELTIAGKMDTDCFVLIADSTGAWHEFPFESPQLCVGGALVLQDANNNPDGVGIVVGIDGNETTVLNIDGVGTDNPTAGSTFPLLQGKIPVAIDDGDPTDDFVYVALHDIGNQPVYNGFGVDRATNLVAIMAYWEKFTDPLTLSQDQAQHTPHILKLNPQTGVVDWKSIDELTHGSATISKMLFADHNVIICGSTNGSGDAYGQNTNSDWNDWDGYVGFINPATGRVDDTFINDETKEIETRGSIRISSGGTNDFVSDMCLIGLDLFVVGTTDGVFSGTNEGGAFVIKIDVQKRIITKQVQLNGSDRTGLKIVCSDDHVFVGGHVEFNDPTIDQKQNVYVTAYDSELSKVAWTVEVDTTPYFGGQPRMDQLVALEFNPAGDVNVLLNSIILAQGISDIIFMDLQGDSGANEIQKGVTASGEGGVPEGGIEVEPIEGDEAGDANLGNQVDSTTTSTDDEEKKQRTVLALSITIPLTIALAIAIYALSERRKLKARMVKPPPVAEQQLPEESPQAPNPVLDSSEKDMV